MPTSDFVRACSLADPRAKGRIVLYGRHSPILVVYDGGRIGMALMEHSVVDARNGRVPNANFAEYAVPVHADPAPLMDVIFVEEHDPHVNPLGVKGVGEIALVGVAPAITNAVFHATGKRIRELPGHARQVALNPRTPLLGGVASNQETT